MRFRGQFHVSIRDGFIVGMLFVLLSLCLWSAIAQDSSQDQPDWDVRAGAAHSLGKPQDQRAVASLQPALKRALKKLGEENEIKNATIPSKLPAASQQIVVRPGQSIQDAIEAAAPGDTILVSSGTYRENINVTKRINLMGMDTGGGKPIIEPEKGRAITLSEDGIKLEGLVALNSKGNSKDWMENFEGAGIAVASNDNIIASNSAKNNEIGIYIRGSNNTIRDNIAINNSQFGILLAAASGNMIASNEINNSFSGIALNGSSGNTMIGNTAIDHILSGIYLVESDGNTIRENIASASWHGIYLSFSNNTLIERNNASYNNYGITISDSGGNIINGNDASYSSEGIGLINSSDNTIEDNNIRYNDFSGIYLHNSSDNTIANNNATDNDPWGIFLGGSSNNAVIGNTAGNNTGQGIYLQISCNNNLVKGNSASDNDYGIYLQDSRDNILYQNSLLENKKNNAYDDTGENQWSKDYIGNRYSDFDQPAEGCVDSDGNGRCDSSYPISGSQKAIDPYPLASRR